MGNEDKTVVKNLVITIGGLVALAVVIFVVAQEFGPGKARIAGTERNIARSAESVTASAAKAATAAPKKTAVAKKPVIAAKKTAAQLNGTCLGCHTTGVANAPKMGDKAAWAAPAKLGVDALVKSVIKGKGAMPPKGATALTDAEIKIVVEDMLKKAGY